MNPLYLAWKLGLFRRPEPVKKSVPVQKPVMQAPVDPVWGHVGKRG